MNTNNIFSVWIDTVNGDLITHGTRAGKSMSREQAWKIVKHYRSDTNATYIRVLRGSSLAWCSAKQESGWTK